MLANNITVPNHWCTIMTNMNPIGAATANNTVLDQTTWSNETIIIIIIIIVIIITVIIITII